MKPKFFKNVLVTGASGFLGGHVMRRLAAENISALGVGRNADRCEALRGEGHSVYQYDLSDYSTVSECQHLSSVDAIIHCAALSAPFGPSRDFERANVSLTNNIIRLAKESGVKRFVHISSPSIYFSYCDQFDVREDLTLPVPVNEYARTKGIAEKNVLSNLDVHPIILRPRGLYGPNDRTLLPRLLRAARRGRLPRFKGHKGMIDLTFVEDAVDAIMAALFANTSAEGEVFNVSGGEVLPIETIVQDCCDAAGIEVMWRDIPLPLAMASAALMENMAKYSLWDWEPPITRYGIGLFSYGQSLDISKAERILNWRPKTLFKEGVVKTFASGIVP